MNLYNLIIIKFQVCRSWIGSRIRLIIRAVIVHIEQPQVGLLGKIASAAKGFASQHPFITVVGVAVGTAVVGKVAGGGGSSSGGDNDYDNTSTLEGNGLSDRSSPVEHDVSGYTRTQNGKEVHVRSYKRGGKNNT